MTLLYILAHLTLAAAGIAIIGQFRDDRCHGHLNGLSKYQLQVSSQASLVNWVAAETIFNIIGFQVGPAWQLSCGILLLAALLGFQLRLWRHALRARSNQRPHS
jgi:hypothetical protein